MGITGQDFVRNGEDRSEGYDCTTWDGKDP